jgi:uncharacterized protein (UPF0276 family)
MRSMRMCAECTTYSEAPSSLKMYRRMFTFVTISMGRRRFTELAQRTGCGALLDVNSLVVNQCNQGEDTVAAMDVLPRELLGEIHRVGRPLKPEVGLLSDPALQRFDDMPTLIEWHIGVPRPEVLFAKVVSPSA